LSLHDALTLNLAAVLAKTPEVNATVHDLVGRLPDLVAWITWAEIAEVTRRQRVLFHDAPHGLQGTVQRLTDGVTKAIEWHS